MSMKRDEDYSLVAAPKDDDDDDAFVDEEDIDDGDDDSVPTASETMTARWIRILHRTWVPEEMFTRWGNQQLLEGVESVRLAKFFLMTVILIVFVHEFVKWFDLEHDKHYSYYDMILYDGNSIIMDLVVFFIVGRLYKHELAVDHLAWMLVVFVSAIYGSLANTFRWLQHSVTLFEIHCTWPWQLFAFVAVVVPLSVMLVIKHVQYAVKVRQLGTKFNEIFLCVMFFLMPQLSSPYFHLHHWFAGWLLGMHCNFDTWWSRATMAWCWGLYINGIAVYGRDPLQTCGYALYISMDTHCSFLSCFMHQEVGPHNETHTVYNDPAVPDWRNCTIGSH